MKLKKVKPATWVTIGASAFVVAVVAVLVAPNIQWPKETPQAALGLYNNKSADRKLNERVELAVRLALKDTKTKKYPMQLEGRTNGAWQVVRKFTATKPDNTVVFRVHPGALGDIIYRAEIKTADGIITTNELTLHITK
ncbi:MAG: hypothetical protein RIQ88_622 [Actinomycetota bacterium]